MTRKGRSKNEEMTTESMVSIITPMYNAEKTIAQTIESVLHQTYQNWEMIIMDDCSSDQSASIVEEYLKQDPRIRYYREKANCGVAKVRNDAIAQAKGEYLAFLDSDDLWRAKKLDCQIRFMKENKVQFCYSACSVIDASGQTAGKVRNVPEVADYNKLLKGNFIPCLTVVLEKRIMLEMPQIPHEDYATWLAILRSGKKAFGLNEVLADYRVNLSSVSANKWKAMKWTWSIYRYQEKLSYVKSCFYFVHYIMRAIRKRL